MQKHAATSHAEFADLPHKLTKKSRPGVGAPKQELTNKQSAVILKIEKGTTDRRLPREKRFKK